MIEVGCLYLYKSDIKKSKYKLVVITSGLFERHGKIRNSWGFTYIDESTGMLTKYTGHDYDNEIGSINNKKFIKVSSDLYKIKYDLSSFWAYYYICTSGDIKKRTG